jgi:uncharacterized protein (DUF1697 family)
LLGGLFVEDICCVFLRGINVNGNSIKMQELKNAFYEMGFSNVKTILATGNVIINFTEGSPDKDTLKLKIENGLKTHFGYDAHVILRDKNEILEIYHTAQTHKVSEGYHHYLLICNHSDLPLELKQLFDSMSHAPNEQLIIFEQNIFWIVPKGNTLESDFGSKVLGSKKYKSRLTSRNMNTIEKIVKSI